VLAWEKLQDIFLNRENKFEKYEQHNAKTFYLSGFVHR
jgi:hypothetical protein